MMQGAFIENKLENNMCSVGHWKIDVLGWTVITDTLQMTFCTCSVVGFVIKCQKTLCYLEMGNVLQR